MRGPVVRLGSEDDLHCMVCDYMRIRYPTVLFRTDFAAGTRLSMTQAVRNKKMQSCRAWPDLFIAEARGGRHGLFVELKVEGTRLYLKDGITMVSNEHYREQDQVLRQLEGTGYRAVFAIGFDQAKDVIDRYLAESGDGGIRLVPLPPL